MGDIFPRSGVRGWESSLFLATWNQENSHAALSPTKNIHQNIQAMEAVLMFYVMQAGAF